MRLNLANQKGISLSEVPNYLPRRNGKKVHYSTVYRWATKGARGRVLETELVGGVRFTTAEALQRFQSGNAATSASGKTLAAIDKALTDAGL